MRSPILCLAVVTGSVWLMPAAQSAEPSPANVAEIQAKHDRAFINELTEYLRKNPRAADRDQAYAALFNKAIEHDWFGETEDLGRQYLKTDPDGPVKALAQIVLTMARARAGRFDEALAQFRELIQGLNQSEQEEFAASFSEDLADLAITAGEFATAPRGLHHFAGAFQRQPQPPPEDPHRAEASRHGWKAGAGVCGRGHPG